MQHVAKVVEIVGTSEVGIDDAIQGAIARAAKTLDNLQWFEVTEMRGHISDQKIERFQVMLKVGFGLNDD
ncbi:MAG: dodecin family protein [Sphingobium sp.]|uniref:dodecin n=1 Tax=Sphingobium sp. TaxID=1912891 RepID=UPI0029A41CDE|nr:dodecin [Sphingobium sp.]MDX3911321.1 dodecin family protein [Sphingobium sp.]